MKRRFTQMLALCSATLLMLASCKKDETRAVVSANATGGTLTSSATSVSLTKANLTSTAVSFTATKPNFGYSAAYTTTLQIAVKGTNFAAPKETPLANMTQSFNVQDFNNMLLALNLPTGTAAQVEARIKYSIGSSAAPLYSNVLTLSATPFALTSWLYAVGSFEGWNLAKVDSLISPTSNGVYTGIINFTAGNNDFLILPQKTNYNNKYATNDPKGTTSSTVGVNAANNFYAPTAAGQYLVTLDINKNTISIVPADYYSLIGNVFAGQNWDTDNMMKYVNDGTGTWTITTAMLATPPNGGFKVRLDGAWAKSWGLLATPDGATLTDNNGGNITTSAAGIYKFTFIMPATAFGYSPAASEKTETTAAYTLTKQ